MRKAEVYEIPMVPRDAEVHDHDRIEFEYVLFVPIEANEATFWFARARIEDPLPIGFIVRRAADGGMDLVPVRERPTGTLLTPVVFSSGLEQRMFLLFSLAAELRENDELRQMLDGVDLGEQGP